MTPRNENLDVLLTELTKVYKDEELASKSHKYEVSEATTFVSNIYERLRNTLDYKDEHLIRRFAIQRFLRVSLSSRSDPEKLTDLLIKDLIRNKYINDSTINDSKVHKFKTSLAKYRLAKEYLNQQRNSLEQNQNWDWLLGVAASELEKILDPQYKPEIYIKLLAQYVLRVLRDSKVDLSPELESLHVFIACHKSLVRSDFSILRYHALSILYPDFFGDSGIEVVKTVVDNLAGTRVYVDTILKSKTQEDIFVQIRKIAAPFKVLQGVLEQNPGKIDEILSNEFTLKDRAEQYIQSYYVELKKKLNTRIARTLIYLFITKMLLAILIEAPVDLMIIKHINYLALAINTIVPVLLFYLIARRVELPGKDNNEKIHKVLKSIVYEDKLFISEQDELTFKKQITTPRSKKNWIWVVYLGLYVLVYGEIFAILSKFGFNFTSILIFYIFISILSFFAWNIRARARDLQIVPRKEGLIQAILNIIALPILKVGQVLSVQVGRFNVFTIIFDFIFEAPFKLIIQSFEDLIDFLKTKHEEVVQD